MSRTSNRRRALVRLFKWQHDVNGAFVAREGAQRDVTVAPRPACGELSDDTQWIHGRFQSPDGRTYAKQVENAAQLNWPRAELPFLRPPFLERRIITTTPRCFQPSRQSRVGRQGPVQKAVLHGIPAPTVLSDYVHVANFIASNRWNRARSGCRPYQRGGELLQVMVDTSQTITVATAGGGQTHDGHVREFDQKIATSDLRAD